jgi:hypothetical protein
LVCVSDEATKKKLKVHSISFVIIGFWNSNDPWHKLRTWSNCLISWKQRTHHANIGVIPLVTRWMKTCMALSSRLLKLLCKKLGTLLSIVMKSQQLTINLGVTFACVFWEWF